MSGTWRSVVFVILSVVVFFGTWKLTDESRPPSFAILSLVFTVVAATFWLSDHFVNRQETSHPTSTETSFIAVRERFLKWLKYQGLALTLFISIAGVSLIDSKVGEEVRAKIDKEIGTLDVRLKDAQSKAETALVDRLVHTQANVVIVRTSDPKVTTQDQYVLNDHPNGKQLAINKVNIQGTNIPKGATVVAAWVTPYHQPNNFNNFETIEVYPDEDKVTLNAVHASPKEKVPNNFSLSMIAHILYYPPAN